MDPVIGVPVTVLFIALVAWVIVRAVVRSELREKAERFMNKESAREARTLLAIHGHRLDKHTRDALTVWLAGQS